MFFILDRDGVINYESVDYIKSAKEWAPIPGSLEAIAMLKKLGHQVVIATNQSGIARGLYNKQTLAQIHQKMHRALAKWEVTVDGIFYCPHHPDDHCICRKPQTGMFLKIEKQFNIHMSQCISIGDSVTDIKAAKAVGCKTVLVLTGNGKQTALQNDLDDLKHALIYPDLASAVCSLLNAQADFHPILFSKEAN